MSQTRPPERPIPTVLLADVLWKRLDRPGLEHCRVMEVAGFYSVQGVMLTIEGGGPYRVNYMIRCDADWATAEVYVNATRGPATRQLRMRRDERGVWWRDDEPVPDVDGLVDIDLSITPATNTLPIRRLKLPVGGSVTADAVWLRFPELSVERLSQRYTRTAERAYRYESNGGAFSAELVVDDEGVVVRYEGLWERVAP